MICKYCEQPIYETEQSQGFPGGPLIYMRGKYRHIENDTWGCEEGSINPNNPNYEKPKCTCGAESSADHDIWCSAMGTPPHYASVVENK